MTFGIFRDRTRIRQTSRTDRRKRFFGGLYVNDELHGVAELERRALLASLVIVSGTGQSATVGTVFGQQMRVKALDTQGNGLAGVSVTFALPASGASGTFVGGPATVLTGADGVATSPILVAGMTWGSYQVTASADEFTPASFVMTNRPFSRAVVVNSASDSVIPGYTNLRQALAIATSQTGDNTVLFDPTVFAADQTIVLNSVIQIRDTTGRTTIEGPASKTVKISGNGATGHFLVRSPATMSNLTLTDGRGAGTLGGAVSGGAILNSSSLTLSEIQIYDCSVTNGYGGAIASSWNNDDSNVSLHATNLSIARTSAIGGFGYGGAIFSGANGTGTSASLTLLNSSIRDTTAKTTAGAISVGTGFFGGTANVFISDVSMYNTKAGQSGGAFDISAFNDLSVTIVRLTTDVSWSLKGGFMNAYVADSAASKAFITVDESTISNSSSTTFGGAFEHAGPGTVTIRDTNFSNVISGDNGGLMRVAGTASALAKVNLTDVSIQNSQSYKSGGVIHAVNATVGITRASVTDAKALGDGGVIHQSSGSLSVADSSFEGSTAANGAGIYATNITTLISGLTAANGIATGSRGGAIFANGGFVAIDQSSFTGNRSVTGGGAIFAIQAELRIDRSQFDQNAITSVTSVLAAGAIATRSGNTTISRSSFTRNSSSGGSGAIQNFTGTLTVNTSSFSENTGKVAGAIQNWSQETQLSRLYVYDSTFTKNNSLDYGGGIASDGHLELSGSVFEGNSAVRWGGALALYSWNIAPYFLAGSGISNIRNVLFLNNKVTGQTPRTSANEGGGGISVYYSEPTFVNCTIVGNDAGIYPGGGINEESPSKITLINTIVAGNLAATSEKDINGGIAAGSVHNLIGDGTGASGITNGVNGDIVGTAAEPIDPLLAPLGNYGGLTLSMPPLPGSPAIGAGKSGAGIPATDQRGKPRTGSIDIGSVETQGFVFASITGSGQSTTVDTGFAFPIGLRVVAQAGDDPVAGGLITFYVPASGASATFFGGVNTSVIGANGTAISAGINANTVAGQYGVTATANGVGGQAAYTLINRAGAAAAISLVSGDSQSAVITSGFPLPLTVVVADAFGNLVENATVNFMVPGSGASATFAGGASSAVSNGSGIATSAALAANGVVGSYVVSATVGALSPVSFSLNNRAPVMDQFVVQKGSTGRSFVRYVDMVFDTTATLGAIAGSVGTANPRIRMNYKGLDGTQNVAYSLSNRVAAVDAVLAIDFGTEGIGGNRITGAGDGIYVVELDLDDDGSFETSRQFFRLLGDVNGDKLVDAVDTSLVAKNIGSALVNSPEDVNGDGVVNATDLLLVRRQRGRRILV